MRAGVIGFGSIGRRHILNMMQLGVHDIVLFREKGRSNDLGLREVFDWEEFLTLSPDFILIANPTSRHFKFLKDILEYGLNVLAEKPLIHTQDEYLQIQHLLDCYRGIGMIAYNLRFHPCVLKVKEMLKAEQVGRPLYAHFFVGQYLPDWHPGQDYRYSYSALKSGGGGVAFDLIHEIDLALFLLGKPVDNECSLLSNSSALEIETEDVADFLWRTSNKSVVSVHLDYLYRGYKRCFEIICEKGTIMCDLFKGEIQINGEQGQVESRIEHPDFERNDMYLELMRNWLATLADKGKASPSLSDGLISLNVVLHAKNK